MFGDDDDNAPIPEEIHDMRELLDDVQENYDDEKLRRVGNIFERYVRENHVNIEQFREVGQPVVTAEAIEKATLQLKKQGLSEEQILNRLLDSSIVSPCISGKIAWVNGDTSSI